MKLETTNEMSEEVKPPNSMIRSLLLGTFVPVTQSFKSTVKRSYPNI